MKFRKKPVIVEAEQWFPGKQVEGVIPPFDSSGLGSTAVQIVASERPLGAYVETIHDGQMVQIAPGDWIIAEPDGKHVYPCKPDIFEATYEPVEGGT